MFRGNKINIIEKRAVLHVALRAPKGASVIVDGENVVPQVYSVLDKMADFSNGVRRGEWKGHTGKTMRNGRIAVNENLEVEGFPGVWAIGDCAMVPHSRTGGFHPPTAQHAISEARVVAHKVAAELRGGQKQPFRVRASAN
jgi:NADPH-dependent 2,4-dienoyl-CoA reductase/sulfur reductase-like enzyme